MFGLSHRQGVLVSIFFIVIFFGFLAKLDFVLGPREYMEGVEYHLPFITVGAHWFWMWIVGYPLIAFVFTGLFLAGADDTDYNMRYGLGIFLTVILFGVGQLEDFLWHVVNWLLFLVVIGRFGVGVLRTIFVGCCLEPGIRRCTLFGWGRFWLLLL
jgi:hypothetical protein